MKKIVITIVAGIVLVVGLIYSTSRFNRVRTKDAMSVQAGAETTSSQSTQTSVPTSENKQTRTLRIGAASLTVEIANTPSLREHGLSNRQTLQENHGMLFDFTATQIPRPTFWMKDMLFDLDLIWIKNNTVVEISRNVQAPKPETPDDTLQLIQPSVDCDMVLEVVSGWSDKNNIHVGDGMTF
jgi:uncharacterized protein